MLALCEIDTSTMLYNEDMLTSILNNADDFGLDKINNRSVKQAIKEGWIKSVSVMTTGTEFEDAVKFLKKHPEVKVGLHFDITERQGLWRTVLKLIFVPGKMSLVDTELQNQFQKLRDTGLSIEHLDSHEHIHVLPPLFGKLVKFARRQGLARLRHCEPRLEELNKIFSLQYHPKRALIILLYYLDYFIFKKYLINHTLTQIDDVLWRYNTSQKAWRKILKSYTGTVENICHLR